MNDQPETRAFQAADYAAIWSLLEAGTPEKAILSVYKIKPETLKKRMAADRPDLWRKYKQLPTSARVVADDQKRAAEIVLATMRALKMDVMEIAGHDMSVLANQARQQQADKLSDPNKVLTPVGLEHARGISSLMKAVATIPESGLNAGSGTSVTVNTLGHAQLLRRGDNQAILASEEELQGAVVDIETRVIE